MVSSQLKCFSSAHGDRPSSSAAFDVVEREAEEDDAAGRDAEAAMFREQWHHGVHELLSDQGRLPCVALSRLHPLELRVSVHVLSANWCRLAH